MADEKKSPSGGHDSLEDLVKGWNSFKTDPLNIPRSLLRIDSLWRGAEDIITSVFLNERTAVKAGHAMSKDWTAGILVVQWLLTYFGNALVIATGPTDRQVKEIVFREVAKQYYRFLELFPKSGFKRDWLTTNKLDFGPDCFALGFSTRDTGETVGKAHGFHAANVLIIVTEAQGVPSSTFSHIKGLITSKNTRILELGNPILEYGDFYEHCTNPKYRYHVIHLPCSESPNIKANSEIIPGMATTEYIERMRQDCGPEPEDDPEYQGRVMAEFPQQSKNAWIPLSKIKEAVNRVMDDPEDAMVVGGLDTAREGNDETVHTVLKGRTCIKQDCFRKVLTPETVGWARALAEEDRLEALGIDIGYNPGIFDWLKEIKVNVIEVNFGKESPHPKLKYFGTYIWYLLREAFMAGEISIPDDPVLIAQLSRRRVEMTTDGKRKLVSKKKEGGDSPDRADSLAIAWYVRYVLIGSKYEIADLGESDASKLEHSITRISSSREAKQNEDENVESEAADLGVNESSVIDY